MVIRMCVRGRLILFYFILFYFILFFTSCQAIDPLFCFIFSFFVLFLFLLSFFGGGRCFGEWGFISDFVVFLVCLFVFCFFFFFCFLFFSKTDSQKIALKFNQKYFSLDFRLHILERRSWYHFKYKIIWVQATEIYYYYYYYYYYCGGGGGGGKNWMKEF